MWVSSFSTRGPRPAARATERRSFHEESRNDRERGRRSEAPRRQYSSFTGEQAERPSRRQEEFSGWSRPGQREARAPRDARPSPWQMESELLPALPDVVRRELDALGQALRTVRPLRSAHYRNLPADIEALSRLLTCERSGLYRPYWSSPASTSAYLYYFLPWNVLRLARLFRSLPLPDPRLWLEKGQTPLLLDGGSGPLSVPLALWLARPEWRALPIQVLAVDNAVQPMELGRDVMSAWGDILGQPVWQVRVERGSLEHMPRLERKLADTLERQERHLRPWLLTAANVLNELSAESRQMNREDDEDEEGSGGVRRLEKLLDELEPLCWPAPLNEDETGSADEALLPAALFVEPGTRLGGKTISRLRDAALERDLMPLAPCTHRTPCPLAHAHAGRGWCHFTFDCEGAPQWLQELSSAAGLAKSALSLAPLLLRADPAAGESLFDDLDDLDDDAPDNSREAAAMLRQPRPVRVLSSPFVVPGLRGQAADHGANSAKHDTVEIPSSNLKKSICQILLDEGYIKNFTVIEDGKQGVIKVTLKYVDGKTPVITGLRRVSKPGLRIYSNVEDMPKVMKGLGIAIISTSKGVMTDRQARAEHVGGEVLAYIW